jgi:hypothetical protein
MISLISKMTTSISINVCNGFTGLASKIPKFLAVVHGFTGCTDQAPPSAPSLAGRRAISAFDFLAVLYRISRFIWDGSGRPMGRARSVKYPMFTGLGTTVRLQRLMGPPQTLPIIILTVSGSFSPRNQAGDLMPLRRENRSKKRCFAGFFDGERILKNF